MWVISKNRPLVTVDEWFWGGGWVQYYIRMNYIKDYKYNTVLKNLKKPSVQMRTWLLFFLQWGGIEDFIYLFFNLCLDLGWWGESGLPPDTKRSFTSKQCLKRTKAGHFSAILIQNSNLLYMAIHHWIRNALLGPGPTDGMALKMNSRYVNWQISKRKKKGWRVKRSEKKTKKLTHTHTK